MAGPTVITTGAIDSGEIVLRLEINDFVKNEKYFSLYVQALTAMMDNDQSNFQSHFQVGGIHGLPYTQWDSAGGQSPINPPGPDDPWDGYCVHGSILFPTWHRPYTALYEQIIQGHAARIADTYTTPDKEEWQQAAKTLRLPYWDWTLKETKGVPPDEVLTLTQVPIVHPDGSTDPVNNPLIAYKFHPIEPTFRNSFKNWKTTLRCPDGLGANAKSRPQQVVTNVRALWEQRNAAVINLLTEVDSWIDMSNHTQAINPNYNASLEAIHDQMHLNVGGRSRTVYGHMADPDYAGHDPIFFNHHANVDHLLWMWQVLHYDKWIEPSTAQDGGTWTMKVDEKINAETPLTPFWKNKEGAFWNSNDVRKPEPLYFTYPILAGLDRSSPEAAKSELMKRIAKQYDIPAAFPHLVSHASGPGPTQPQTPLPSGRNEGRDWRVHIQSVKYALGGSYSVFVFLGEVPEEPNDWTAAPSLVGIHDVFARDNPAHCANCNRHPDLIDEGVLFLGPALYRAQVQSLEPSVVEPYLQQNLHWRIMKPGEGELPMTQLSSLKVSIVSVPLRLERLPVQIGAAHRHPAVTIGRPGGADDVQV